jgi:tripartite-type tricarboxylate transporter receptor subunit TctC
MPYNAKVTATQSWADIPTCKSQGMDVDYQMLRGIFMPGGVTKDQVAFYVDLFKKIQATPDWKEFMEKGAFDTTTLTGDEFVKWLTKEELRHQSLMAEAGFLAKK